MIVAYRIAKARYRHVAFSGEGARIAGGRWNFPGARVVYCSDSLALAAMELFVHIGDEGLAIRFVYFRILIPSGVRIDRCAKPPRRWRAEPPQEPSMRYGSAWIARGRTAVLEVPSAIVPLERNFLLNPLHPDFKRVQIDTAKPFVFDPRMWK